MEEHRDQVDTTVVRESDEAAPDPGPGDPHQDATPVPAIARDGFELPRKVAPLQASADALAGPFGLVDEFFAGRRATPGPGCWPNTGSASIEPKTLPARGDVQQVQLFRRKSGDSCVPTEHCHMAIRNEAGWWVGRRLCVGPIDADRAITTADTSLRWVRVRSGAAVLVEYTVVVRDHRTRATLEDFRWMQLCGAGASGRVTCTRPALLACTSADGSASRANVTMKDGVVSVTSDETAEGACGGHEAFLLGDFEVSFP